MSRPWMPLYVGDYIADTSHLSCAESGAYLHLMMHYWMKGGLPDDDRQLSRIAKMTAKEWAAARETIQAFFIDGWKHKRIEFELTEAARISAAGKAGGKASGAARRSKQKGNDRRTTDERSFNDRTNDQGNDPPTKCEALQSQSQSKIDRDRARATHDEFLKVAKIDPDDPAFFGTQHHIEALVSRGFSRETILAGTARAIAGKPKPPSWNYIAKCIETENEERSSPAKPEVRNGKTENLSQVARRMAGAGIDFGPRPDAIGGAANRPDVRMLSQGGRERS